MSWSISPALAAWMSPVILGLLLSIPTVMLTSTRAAGQWLRRRRIFCRPEVLSPPPVLGRANDLRPHRAAASRSEWHTFEHQVLVPHAQADCGVNKKKKKH